MPDYFREGVALPRSDAFDRDDGIYLLYCRRRRNDHYREQVEDWWCIWHAQIFILYHEHDRRANHHGFPLCVWISHFCSGDIRHVHATAIWMQASCPLSICPSTGAHRGPGGASLYVC